MVACSWTRGRMTARKPWWRASSEVVGLTGSVIGDSLRKGAVPVPEAARCTGARDRPRHAPGREAAQGLALPQLMVTGIEQEFTSAASRRGLFRGERA